MQTERTSPSAEVKVTTVVGIVLLKQRCKRCGGNMACEQDYYGLWTRCLQCGRGSG